MAMIAASHQLNAGFAKTANAISITTHIVLGQTCLEDVVGQKARGMDDAMMATTMQIATLTAETVACSRLLAIFAKNACAIPLA